MVLEDSHEKNIFRVSLKLLILISKS